MPELETAGENRTAGEPQRTQSLALFQALEVLKDDEELGRARSDSSGTRSCPAILGHIVITGHRTKAA